MARSDNENGVGRQIFLAQLIMVIVILGILEGSTVTMVNVCPNMSVLLPLLFCSQR